MGASPAMALSAEILRGPKKGSDWERGIHAKGRLLPFGGPPHGNSKNGKG
jgi:hypothetical protein